MKPPQKEALIGASKAKSPIVVEKTEGYQVRRWVQRLDEGLVRLDQEIRVKDVQRGTDITGRFWIFGLIRTSRGRVEYLRGSERIAAPAELYGMFVPPYSVIEVMLTRSRSFSMALSSAGKLPETVPREPVVFIPSSHECPSSISEMVDLIRKSSNFIEVGRAKNPSPLAVRVKDAIDRSYEMPRHLSEIAGELRISPAVMSRYFKKAYGLAPVHYRHHLPTMDGMMRLLKGEAVKDVFQEVGFDDLSRFYHHFRQHMIAPPAKYRGR